MSGYRRQAFCTSTVPITAHTPLDTEGMLLGRTLCALVVRGDPSAGSLGLEASED